MSRRGLLLALTRPRVQQYTIGLRKLEITLTAESLTPQGRDGRKVEIFIYDTQAGRK